MGNPRFGYDVTFNALGLAMTGAGFYFDQFPPWLAALMLWGGIGIIVVYWVWRLWHVLGGTDGILNPIPLTKVRRIANGMGEDLSSSSTPSSNMAYAIEGSLRQSARDGRLKVWGRLYTGRVADNQPLELIPAAHFSNFTFAHGYLHYASTDNTMSHTQNSMLKHLKDMPNEAYYDLHLSPLSARAATWRGIRAGRKRHA